MIENDEKTKINKDNFIIKVLCILRTTIIVIFGEIFFKAPSVKSALYIIKNIFINKGGTCNSDDNLVINIDLYEE